MRQECYVGMHRNLAIWLGTPMMILTWVVIPIMPAFLLFLHRKELGKPGIQLQFGYIYRCYRSIQHQQKAAQFLCILSCGMHKLQGCAHLQSLMGRH